MEFAKNILRELFSGRLTRLEYFVRAIVVFILSIGIISGSALFIGETAKSELGISIGAIFVYVIAGLIMIGNFIYTMSCNIRRFRDVLSTIPNSEVYFVFVILFILGFIPGIGFLFNIILMITLFLLPSNFSKESFYQENLNEIISHWTQKILGRK